MKKNWKYVFCSILYFVASSFQYAQISSNDANPKLDDPLLAFENISTTSREIAIDHCKTEFPVGGHFQGIQSQYNSSLKMQICFISSDSDSIAYIIIASIDPNADSLGEIGHVQYLPSDSKQPSLKHAGGIQLIGNYLVIGVEDNQDKLRSEIQFWNVSDPFAPKQRTPLTIIRHNTLPKEKTAGAVGIVKRESDHLIVVANWDTKALDFYTSNGFPLYNDSCRFTFNFRWAIAEAKKDLWTPNSSWGSYQNINLISDSDFNLFLIGSYTNSEGLDLIDLYSIDLSKEPNNIIQKLSSKKMNLSGDAHFQHSGGIFVKSSTELICFATERKEDSKIIVNVSP